MRYNSDKLRVLFLAQPIVIPFSRIGSHHSHHQTNVDHSLTIAEYENGLKWHFFTGLLYTVNTTIVKCSICCLMLRIVRKSIHRWIFQSVIHVSGIAASIRITVWVVRCKDMSDNWRDMASVADGGTCGSQSLLTYVSIFFSIICIATDLVCAIVPAVIVKNLHLCHKQKVYLSIMLGLGVMYVFNPSCNAWAIFGTPCYLKRSYTVLNFCPGTVTIMY
jgi:hypothetical protein